jgi:hypothetical protein
VDIADLPLDSNSEDNNRMATFAMASHGKTTGGFYLRYNGTNPISIAPMDSGNSLKRRGCTRSVANDSGGSYLFSSMDGEEDFQLAESPARLYTVI